MTRSPKTMLAIETVLGGGSVSLWISGAEVSNTVGNSNTNLSETLIEIISRMFNDKQIEPADLDLIAVSLGPGSYTGIRVGIATALGFKNATEAEIAGVSTLRALAETGKGHSGIMRVAINAGREEVISQQFNYDDGEIHDCGKPELIGLGSIVSDSAQKIIIDRSTFESLESMYPGEDLSAINTASDNVAKLVAAAALEDGGRQSDLKPVYTREFSTKTKKVI